MEDRTQPADTDWRSNEHQREQREPSAPRRALVEPMQEARTPQPALASDGQLVEAGYGHGV
jgi:hypothetical protein